MPRAVLPPPMGVPLLPDLPNWSWHEYGMRVGFWRFLDCMVERRIVPDARHQRDRSARPIRESRQPRSEAGWEFMGHGWFQGPMHGLEDQRASIRRTIEDNPRPTGAAPRGWESPGLTETLDTLDLLADEGIEYVADWVLDDQPCELRTANGTIVSLPYTVELNDVAIIGGGAALLGRDAQARSAPVRPAVLRKRRHHADHVDQRPPVSLGRAAPYRLP